MSEKSIAKKFATGQILHV